MEWKMKVIFKTDIVRKGSEYELPILAFVYDVFECNKRTYIRKEFVHDKENKNYDMNFKEMHHELGYTDSYIAKL